MGVLTRLGNAGISLSGGQKQRLLIARAVYRHPRMFILDEATSSLDALTESRILHNLTKFYKDMTVIIVAHRLSTIKNSDNIVFIENGKVIESGTHDSLAAARGSYYELVKHQLVAYDMPSNN